MGNFHFDWFSWDNHNGKSDRDHDHYYGGSGSGSGSGSGRGSGSGSGSGYGHGKGSGSGSGSGHGSGSGSGSGSGYGHGKGSGSGSGSGHGSGSGSGSGSGDGHGKGSGSGSGSDHGSGSGSGSGSGDGHGKGSGSGSGSGSGGGQDGNHDPVACDDEVHMVLSAHEVVSGEIDFMLANDWDPDGDILTVVGVSSHSALGAAISLSDEDNDGVVDTISYDPTVSDTLSKLPQGETVADYVTYTISDGNGGTATATIALTVAGSSDSGSSAGLTVYDTAGESEFIEGSDDSDTFIIEANSDDYWVTSFEEDGHVGTVIENMTTGEVDFLLDFEEVRFNDETVYVEPYDMA